MSELFPTRLRGLGIGAWYNLTVALFGGTAPLVIQWLSNISHISHSSWFFWYVAVGAAVAFVATLTLPETKGSVLG
jgi:MHS family alpha-ketoglutarate permease-like MFS transporter